MEMMSPEEAKPLRKIVLRPVMDEVNDASFDSFPASDPPSWTSMRAGPPRARDGEALRRSGD